MTMRESKVEEHLVEIVQDHLGGYCPKLKFINQNGAPDRLCLLPNQDITFAETKRLGRPLDDHQDRMFKRLRSLGFQCVKFDDLKMIDRFFGIK